MRISKKINPIVFIGLSLVLGACAPMVEEGGDVSESSSITSQGSSQSGQGQPLPPVSPSPVSTSGSGVGTSYTGQEISLQCLSSGLTVSGHDYSEKLDGSLARIHRLSCDESSPQAIMATVMISEKQHVAQSLLTIGKIELKGAPAPQKKVSESRVCTSGCRRIGPHFEVQGTAYAQILPKVILTLPATPTQGVRVINLGFLNYQTQTIGVSAGVTQQITSYILTPTQDNEHLKDSLDNATLEIFFGRHECGYSKPAGRPGDDVVAAERAAAMNSCETGGGTRVWNDRVFLLQLKTR